MLLYYLYYEVNSERQIIYSLTYSILYFYLLIKKLFFIHIQFFVILLTFQHLLDSTNFFVYIGINSTTIPIQKLNMLLNSCMLSLQSSIVNPRIFIK